MPKLTPVDYDPFAAAKPVGVKGPTLMPVDHDPFAAAPSAPTAQPPAQVLPDTNVVAPARLPGVLGTINDAGNDMGDAFAHHLGNIPVGLAQLIAHGMQDSPLALGAELGGRITGAPEGQPNPVTAGMHQLTNTLDDKIAAREKTYQEDVPTNTASVTGATLGEVLPWLFGIGEARTAGIIPTAVTKLQKVGTLAAEGGTMGAVQPVTTGADQPELAQLVEGEHAAPSYASQKALQIGTGAATGPVLAGIGKLLGGAKAGVQDILTRIRDPQTVADKYIAELFNANPQVLAKLQAAQPLVPGEVPSAAQVIATPDAVKAERLLRNNPNAGPAFENVENANNQARQAVIDKLAGTDDQLSAAIENRRSAAAPFIEASLQPATPAKRWGVAKNAIENLVAKPGRMPAEDFDALKAAKALVDKVRKGDLQEDDAIEEMQHLADSVTTKKAQDAFGSAFAGIEKNMIDPKPIINQIALLRNTGPGARATIRPALDAIANTLRESQNVRGKVPIDVLDSVRQNIKDYIIKPSGERASGQEIAALDPIKAKLTSLIDTHAPGYSDYLATYARNSEPINTMESVRKLVDPNAPGSLDSSGNPRTTVNRLRQVLRGDDKARYPMSDAARSDLDKLRDSLLRRSISDNKIAASGPGTAADLQAADMTRLGSLIFGDPLAGKPGQLTRALGIGVGSTLGHLVPIPGGGLAGAIIGGALPEAVGKVNARIATKIGETAASSKATADAIQRALSKATPQQRSLLGQLLLGNPAQPAAIGPPALGQAVRQAGVSATQQKVATP